MALRHQLWLVLPLSITDGDRLGKHVNSGMYGVGSDVRLGSVAVGKSGSLALAVALVLDLSMSKKVSIASR